MAARTSSQSGPWGNSDTWGGDPAPGPADTATVTTEHTVAISDARTVAGWTQQGSGVLVISAAGALTSTGATWIEGNGTDTPKVTVAAGGSLLWNPAAGATVTHQWGGNYLRYAGIQARGTASARCTIGKAPGAAGLLLGRSDYLYLHGTLDAEYSDVDGWGDATNDGLTLDVRYFGSFRLVDCRVRDGGRLAITLRNFDPGTVFELARTKWSGTLGETSLRVNTMNPPTGVATVHHCAFDKTAEFFPPAGLAIDYNFMEGGTYSTPGLWQSFSHNFIRDPGQPPTPFPASFSDCYFFEDSNHVNPHGISISGSPSLTQDVILDGLIFESVAGTEGDFIMPEGPVAPYSSIIRNSILLPNPTGTTWNTPGKFVALLGMETTKVRIEHCTYPVSDHPESGVAVGETYYGHAGMIDLFRSNIAWRPTAGTGGHMLSRIAGAVQDIAAAEDCDSNWGWNLAAGSDGAGYHASAAPPFFSTGTPGLNDGSGDPRFVDRFRNLAKWALDELGSVAAAAAGQRADALSALRADPARIDDLLAYVRAGFAPRNAALATAAHDGTTVGAVAASVVVGPLLPLARLAAWKSHIHDRHSSGAFPYVGTLIPPRGPAINAAEHYDVTLAMVHARDYCSREVIPPVDWDPEIAASLLMFRDGYLLPLPVGQVQRHVRYTAGLCRHYWETGDPDSLAAFLICDEAPDGSMTGFPVAKFVKDWASQWATREIAYYLYMQVDRAWMGLSYTAHAEASVSLLLGHIAEWTMPPASRYAHCCQPFMAALNIRTLIAYWDRFRADPTRAATIALIPPAIESCLEYLWADCWYPVGQAVLFEGATDGAAWDKGSFRYSNPHFAAPSMAPIEGLAFVTVDPDYTFTGPASLSTIDDYYKHAFVDTVPAVPGVEAGRVLAYEGAARKFTLHPTGDRQHSPGAAFRIYSYVYDPAGPVAAQPAPDLNQIIAPAYAWAYWHRKVILGDAAGALVHRARHDAIFDGGIMSWQAAGSQKVWNQTMFWATMGLDWRERGDAEWPAATVLTLQAPAQGAAGEAGARSGPFRLSIPHRVSLEGTMAVTPISSTGRGTFNPATPILTTDRPWAIVHFTPDRLDQNTVVSLTVASSLADPVAVPFTAGDGPPTPFRYDFGTTGSLLAAGYTRVTAVTAYNPTAGFGWIAGTIDERDRGPGTDLTRDVNFTYDGTFAVDLVEGTYMVAVTLGDTGPYLHDLVGVYLQGAQVDTVSTAAGEVVTKTYSITVAGGPLLLRLKDMGGTDAFAVIQALEITPGAVSDHEPAARVLCISSPQGGILCYSRPAN